MIKETKIKAYCNIVSSKGGSSHNEKGLVIDLMGTAQNPYFCVFPKTKNGLKWAQGNCNSYMEVAECEIIFKPLPPHKCNCNKCKLK